jgi:hypothetical protein
VATGLVTWLAVAQDLDISSNQLTGDLEAVGEIFPPSCSHLHNL